MYNVEQMLVTTPFVQSVGKAGWGGISAHREKSWRKGSLWQSRSTVARDTLRASKLCRPTMSSNVLPPVSCREAEIQSSPTPWKVEATSVN